MSDCPIRDGSVRLMKMPRVASISVLPPPGYETAVVLPTWLEDEARAMFGSERIRRNYWPEDDPWTLT